MGIDSDREIDSCHILGSCKTKSDQDQDNPCTVVCRFNIRKDKQCILNNAKKLKDTDIFIYEGLSKENMELRKTLHEQVLEYQMENKFACLCNMSIIVKCSMLLFSFCFTLQV